MKPNLPGTRLASVHLSILFLTTCFCFLTRQAHSADLPLTTQPLELSDDEAMYWGMPVDTPLPYRLYSNDRYQTYEFRHEITSYDDWRARETRIVEESRDFSFEGTVTLDLVFHIMHSTDTTHVLDQINQQIETLNRDFGSPQYPERDEMTRKGCSESVPLIPVFAFSCHPIEMMMPLRPVFDVLWIGKIDGNILMP